MTGPITQPPRILKTMLILVIVFFSLVILFNIWMKSALRESSTDIKTTTTLAAPKSKAAEKSLKIVDEKTEAVEIEYETPIKGDLLLQ